MCNDHHGLCLCVCIRVARISFQMTSPSAPTSGDTVQLVNNLSRYISEGSPIPDFVQEGVAEEAAVGLAVSEMWLNSSSQPSDYITRRYYYSLWQY